MIRAAVLFLALIPQVAEAQGFTPEFSMPAERSAERSEAFASYLMPIGPWRAEGGATLAVEGRVQQTAFRLQSDGKTTLQLLAALRDQLQQDGYRLLYECAAQDCGGFDFRFETEVLPEPEMHVDLGDYRYLAAERRAGAGADHVSLLVSRSSDAGFVQVMQVSALAAPTPAPLLTAPARSAPPLPELAARPAATLPDPGAKSASTPGGNPAAPAAPLALSAALEAGGSVPLDDLSFAPGSSDLAAGTYPSLAALAAYLAAHPDRHIMLVGHTDASGGLEGNIALSRKRAASVLRRLIDDLGVAKTQLDAEGVGFLAPLTSNLTEAGRTRNRRVEAVLTSTQ